jgi:hypothetical protein
MRERDMEGREGLEDEGWRIVFEMILHRALLVT